MTISFEKVLEFIHSNQFVCNIFFVKDDLCCYIDAFSIELSENVIIYIPTKYQFKVPNFESRSRFYKFKIKTIKEYDESDSEDEDDGDDEQSEIALQDNDEINVDIDSKNVEKNLNDRYKKSIKLRDLTDKDVKEITAIKKQLRRLSFSTENLDYKFCILYKDIFATINRSNNMVFVKILNYPRTNNKKRFFIQTNLELLFEKKLKSHNDILNVRTGFHNLLKKNQVKHIDTLNKTMDEFKNVVTLQTDINTKIQKYDEFIAKFNNMNLNIEDAEKRIQTMMSLEKSNPMYDKASQINFLNMTKKDVNAYSILTKEKYDNVLLNIDTILFNNIVMLNNVCNNMEELKKLLE